MRCAGCGRENREGRKFCTGCGASLVMACPACGAPSEPDESFCGECGAEIRLLAVRVFAVRENGAPIAHEDHARRACYAALHLRDRLRQYADELRLDPGVNFSFRLGLNSREALDFYRAIGATGHAARLARELPA